MKINCVIIEDEPLALERAKNYVQKLPFLNLTACFENGLDALSYLKTNTVNLLFLDIHLGELSGIQLLETSEIKSQVILTTAYHEYALKGFDLKVADYLLKPYTFERFVQAVGRVQAFYADKKTENTPTFIFVKTAYKLEKIMLDDILLIEGKGDYRRIHTSTKSVMTQQTFSELEQQIPSNLLCRVHKSWMVALDKIDSIEKDRIKIGAFIVPISETYKVGFFEKIGI
ncbi:MAG: LytTR family DNA-binding domain-containing protein [Bacteroidota bacterium]